jgi:hypothetical protein
VRASERADVRALPILGDALHFFLRGQDV